MKRYLTLVLLVLSFAAVKAQDYKVSTGEVKRGVLLEEFTGSGCPNCPDGHRIANDLANSYKGQVLPVSIHTGSFAPNKGSFILRTDDGEVIASFFHASSYPTGMVSRHDFGSGFVFGRDRWAVQAKKLVDEIATVNLYADASFDGGSRELKVHVEGYNTADNSSKEMRLHVMLLQDNIIGYQAGSAEGSSYVHNHVLRDCISDAEGDAVSSKAEGEFFTADYSCVLPADIRGQLLKMEDAHLVVFVTDNGMEDVAHAISIRPSYSNMGITPSAELSSPLIPIGESYGFQFFEAGVKNMSEERVTKAVFEVSVNDKTEEVTAECDINAFETGYTKIPFTYDMDNKMSYKITLKRINDHDIAPVSMSGSFDRPVTVDNEVLVDIKSDKCSDENEFALKDRFGNVVMTFGEFENGKTNKFSKKIKLEKADTYCVEIIDHVGNGMEHGTRGHLIVTTGDNDLIDYIDNIPAYGARVFFTVENDLAIDGITMEENMDGRTYSLNGMVLDGSCNKERIVIRNGKKYTNP